MSYQDKHPYKFFNEFDPEEVSALESIVRGKLYTRAQDRQMEDFFELLIDSSCDEGNSSTIIGELLIKVNTSIDYEGSVEYSSSESTTNIYIYGVGGREVCEIYYTIDTAHCCESVLTSFEVILPEMEEEKEVAQLSKRVYTNERQLDKNSSLLTMAKAMNKDDFIIKGENNMSTRNIRTINLSLTDNNENLKLDDTLVFTKQGVRTEHNDNQTQQNILVSGEVQEALEKHNKKRIKTVDKQILNNTGNKVMLEPIEIWDLQWEVVRIA